MGIVYWQNDYICTDKFNFQKRKGGTKFEE